MKYFLVVHNINSGFAELANVGVFCAETRVKAEDAARKQWRTNAVLYAIALDECEDGWSFYN